MKIITELEQYNIRLDEINDVIERTDYNLNAIKKQISSKNNWPILSLVMTSYPTLFYKKGKLELQLKLLKEYKEMILEKKSDLITCLNTKRHEG